MAAVCNLHIKGVSYHGFHADTGRFERIGQVKNLSGGNYSFMEQHGISKLDLKRRNRMQVLKILKQRGPTSRIDIAGTLELTRAAVTIITNEMIEQGIIGDRRIQARYGESSERQKEDTYRHQSPL